MKRHAGFRAELPAEVLGRIAEPLGGLLETQRLRGAQVVADLADHRGAVRGGVLPGAADQRAEQQLGKAGHQQRLARLRVPRVAADRIEKLLEAFALCFEHAGGQRGPLAFVSVQKILRAVHDVDLAALGRKRLGGVDIARADDDDFPEVERQDLRVDPLLAPPAADVQDLIPLVPVRRDQRFRRVGIVLEKAQPLVGVQPYPFLINRHPGPPFHWNIKYWTLYIIFGARKSSPRGLYL